MNKASIREAIAYFTGGAFKPSGNSQWTDLQNWILQKEHTPWEFCYFIVHAHPVNKQGSGALKFLNWLQKDEVKKEFLAWCEQMDMEASCICKSQLSRLEALNNLGVSMLPILLNDHEDHSAIVRMDFALKHLQDPSKVCVKYAPTADYILRGCPIFGAICPSVAEYVERNLPQ